MASESLPLPNEQQRACSESLARLIHQRLLAQGGWMGFDQWMSLALYSPGLGYYSGPRIQWGAPGDFVTAPELTPLFGQALATQIAQWLRATAPDGPWRVLEFGAGSGALAASLLPALEAVGTPVHDYLVLEVSGTLRDTQARTLRERAADWVDRVRWLEALPPRFEGVMLGNEVLDAMPVRVFESGLGAWVEQGVGLDATGQAFCWQPAPVDTEIPPGLPDPTGLPPGYRAELGEQAQAWIRSVAEVLERGALLLVDYGFPAHEFFHPQRSQGTLMAHYRHRAHSDLLAWPGLQDLTAHVDFTAIAGAACLAGLELAGFVSQGRLLLNCGILELAQHLVQQGRQDPERVKGLGALQTLLSEAEMGELFKAMALTRGLSAPEVGWLGFASGDRRAALGVPSP
jgi:SAM-dependent MidA family methyltransferase